VENDNQPKIDRLAKITIRNTKHLTEESGWGVLHVRDTHALVQAAGYLKYTCAQNGEVAFFRGQTRTHETLVPTLFRNAGESQNAQAKRVAARNRLIEQIRSKCSILKDFSRSVHEPLLQHYGISTTWIDLVDNIWVALWFACHRAHISGKKSEYLHFERRNVVPGVHEFAYILFVAADNTSTNLPGFYKGENTEFTDLRVVCPSIFLRPHSQHGILFRLRGQGPKRPTDYSKQIRGIVRIDLSDALTWLGNAPTLGMHALFPPPYYDHGYKILLDGKFQSDDGVGSISIVGA